MKRYEAKENFDKQLHFTNQTNIFLEYDNKTSMIEYDNSILIFEVNKTED